MDEGEYLAHAASQAAPPYLPGEITDVIISFLPDVDGNFIYRRGYGSLCSCALVCRNWLPASRHTLFTHAIITSDEQYALFISSAVRSESGRSWLLSTRQFSLYDLPSYGLSKKNSTRLFIHELGGQFPNLERLHLHSLKFDMVESSPSPRKFAALSAFASVRILALWNCRFPSFAAARYTLASLHSLTDLTVVNTTWPIAGSSQPLLPFPRSSRKSPFLRRLRSLEILYGDATCNNQMLQWLSTTSLAASLADLATCLATFTTEVTGFWEYVGPSTTRLTIKDIWVEDLLKDSFIGSLPHFTSLRSLAINITFRSEVFEPWESIGALISTGSLNSGIKILSLHLTWHPPRNSADSGSLSTGLELMLREAQDLDSLIDNHFNQLTTLSLKMHFPWPSDTPDDWDNLRTRFSQPAVIKDALWKKLPKISQKVCLNVSVSHLGGL